MKKYIALIAMFAISVSFVGCGANTANNADVSDKADTAQVVQVGNYSTPDVEPVDDKTAPVEATTEYQTDWLTDKAKEILVSEENLNTVAPLKGTIGIYGLDGVYVVTPEQFDELTGLVAKTNWYGTFETTVEMGREVYDEYTDTTYRTMSNPDFWLYYNNVYVLTGVDVQEWYDPEKGTDVSGIEFDNVKAQTRYGKITLCTPKVK